MAVMAVAGLMALVGGAAGAAVDAGAGQGLTVWSEAEGVAVEIRGYEMPAPGHVCLVAYTPSDTIRGCSAEASVQVADDFSGGTLTAEVHVTITDVASGAERAAVAVVTAEGRTDQPPAVPASTVDFPRRLGAEAALLFDGRRGSGSFSLRMDDLLVEGAGEAQTGSGAQARAATGIDWSDASSNVPGYFFVVEPELVGIRVCSDQDDDGHADCTTYGYALPLPGSS